MKNLGWSTKEKPFSDLAAVGVVGWKRMQVGYSPSEFNPLLGSFGG